MFLCGGKLYFYGAKLLTTENPAADTDMELLRKLGIKPEQRHGCSDEAHEATISKAIDDKATEHLFYPA